MPKVNMPLLEQLLEQKGRNDGVPRSQLLIDIQLHHKTFERMKAGKSVRHGVLKKLAKSLGLSPYVQLIAPDDQSNSGVEPPEKWDERWDNLLGDWMGDIEQQSGPDGGKPYRGTVELDFVREGNTIAGCYWFTFEETTYACSGTVTPLGEGHYRFEAESGDDESGKVGLMVNTFYFKLKRCLKEIEGNYVGLGPHSDCIVYGLAKGKKVRDAVGTRRDVTGRPGAGGGPDCRGGEVEPKAKSEPRTVRPTARGGNGRRA